MLLNVNYTCKLYGLNRKGIVVLGITAPCWSHCIMQISYMCSLLPAPTTKVLRSPPWLCRSVCLSVSNISKKVWRNFHKIFRICRTDLEYYGFSWSLSVRIKFYHYHFLCECVCVLYSWKLHVKSDVIQGTIGNMVPDTGPTHAKYRKVSNISRTKFQNLSDSRPTLQLSSHNLLQPCIKSRMKM